MVKDKDGKVGKAVARQYGLDGLEALVEYADGSTKWHMDSDLRKLPDKES